MRWDVGARDEGRLWAAVLELSGGQAGVGSLVAFLTGVSVSPPQNVRIDPSSLSFNMWKDIPVPFYLSVYFFDIVNPSAILQGQKPQVRERGPYVYR